MSKLSWLHAGLLTIASASLAEAQQPYVPQRYPQLFAQAPTPDAPQGQPMPPGIAPEGTAPSTGQTPSPQSHVPMPQTGPGGPSTYEGQMIYGPNGQMIAPDQAFSMQGPDGMPGPEMYDPNGYSPGPYGGQPWQGGPPRGWHGHHRAGWGHPGAPHGFGGDPCADPGCSCHHGGVCQSQMQAGCPPLWYLRAEGVWLSRNDQPTRNLSVFDDDGNHALEDRIVLSTRDLDPGTAPGTRIVLGRYLSERTSLEGSFYGLHDWDDRVATPLEESAQPYNAYFGDDDESSFDVSAFSGSAQQEVSFDSNFNSAEFGLRRWMRSDTSLLLGLRYMGIDERLTFLSHDDGPSDPSSIGLYDIRTENNLFGVQVGTEYVHQIGWHWLYFNAEAKGGLFLNKATHDSQFFVSTPSSASDSTEEDSLGFARNAEFSIGLTAQLTEHFSLRGGWTVNYINGLAVAADQIDTTPHRVNSREYINDEGTVIYHGAYFGGEWIFD
ncbi:MAG: BBP7 family outer membrane beta-barrel protein [Planctomycetaceae bacterium]